MPSYLYKFSTGAYEPVDNPALEDGSYAIPNLPGDPEEYKVIPAHQAYNPDILQLLARHRPALAEASANPSRPRTRVYDDLDNTDDEDSLQRGEPEDITVTHTCDEIRQLINALIDSGQMKVSQFTKAIQVSGPGYYRFMKQNGPDKGSGCEAYTNAMRFFQRRERNGLANSVNQPVGVPQKRLKLANGGAVRSGPGPKTAASIASASTVAPLKPSGGGAGSVTSHTSSTPAPPTHTIAPGITPSPQVSVSGIHLDGFNTESVPVYDNCDIIRARIAAYLHQPGITQASFLRTLMEQYPVTERKIQSVQLSRFRQMAGEEQGTNNPVFYAAYVFFERARIAAGTPKTEERVKKEVELPLGIDVDRR